MSAGAALAAERALDKAGLSPSDVEMLVYGAVCREDFEPATACHVAARLGSLADHATVYDVSNACLGVMTGMVQVASAIELGPHHVRPRRPRARARADINEVALARLLKAPTMENFLGSVATFTGGSGAIAVLLTRDDAHAGIARLLGGTSCAAPEHHELCRWGIEPHALANAPDDDPALREFARTDSAGVLKHGVALGQRTWSRFLETLKWRARDVDKTICHQIGAAHQQTMLEVLGRDSASDYATYKHLGNMGTVALPMATALAHERDWLEVGDKVGLLGIGSGLNCTMLGAEWGRHE